MENVLSTYLNFQINSFPYFEQYEQFINSINKISQSFTSFLPNFEAGYWIVGNIIHSNVYFF